MTTDPSIETPSHSWKGELKATMLLAWPLIMAQLAQMSLFTTDVVMMGWLGPDFLAAGTLATAFLHPLFVFAMGVLFAVSPLVANAIGAGDEREVRRATRQGLWAALLIGFAMVPIMWQVEGVLLLLGQQEANAALAGTYMIFAAWVFPVALTFHVFRTLLSAHNHTMIILVATLCGVVVNALANYALMFGHWGFPRLELYGSGIATLIANSVMAGILMAVGLLHRHLKRYQILLRFWQPDAQKLLEILRVGTPIGLMFMAEVGMFAVVSIMMGWISTAALAAHAVAIQCAGFAFMVPMGLSQATTIRVGISYGRQDKEGIAKAGWVSLLLSLLYSTGTCLLFLAIPETLIGLFLNPADSVNTVPFQLAVGYLWVAAIFQLADGGQMVGGAALRGLKDTAKPMWMAVFGYWGLGMPIAYYCGFIRDLGGQGVWYGLAAGLTFAAIVLCIRFMMRERLGLLNFDQVSEADIPPIVH